MDAMQEAHKAITRYMLFNLNAMADMLLWETEPNGFKRIETAPFTPVNRIVLTTTMALFETDSGTVILKALGPTHELDYAFRGHDDAYSDYDRAMSVIAKR